MSTIYTLIHEKEQKPVEHYTHRDNELFKKKNEEGYGVYFSVNDFDGRRKEENLLALRYAYADFDVAKNGDGQTQEAIDNKKLALAEKIIRYCEPTAIVWTRNGLQPLWELQNKNKERKEEYIAILKGIRKWSIENGSLGDGVYDVSRVLRVSGFYHQKAEPYLCELVHKTDKKYSYEELKLKFPYEEETPKPLIAPTTYQLTDVDRAIDALDIKEIVSRALSGTGRTAEWDKTDRLILDGRLTGTFQGKEGDRQFLASSSHEPFKGNKITVVADILGLTNKDARKWIIEAFNISPAKAKAQKFVEELKTEVSIDPLYETKRFTWGTRGLDTSVAIIKPNNFIVLGAKHGSGKTTYAYDMAMKNARDMGHTVLFVSLEMEEKDILNDIGRKYSGITIEEERYGTIPEHKIHAYERKTNEIRSIKNLIFRGIRRAEGVGWDTIEAIITEKPVDMVFIDNLDLIAGEDNEHEIARQKRITAKIMHFTSEKRVPVVLIHHYRKSGKEDRGTDELSGSAKIADNADRVVRVVKSFDPDAVYPENYASEFYLQKGRGYPECKKKIYFIKGTFVDMPPVLES